MKWITREKAKVDRIACPWLIARFVDPKAEFLYAPKDQVLDRAKAENAIPFDTPGAELHHFQEDGDERCSFDAIVRKYKLKEPPLLNMPETVRPANAGPKKAPPKAAGLRARALGFLTIANDDR